MILLVMLVCITPTISSAVQVSSERETTQLSMLIVDNQNRGIANVLVQIANTEQSLKVQSDDSGKLGLQLRAGTYTFTFEKNGLKKVIVPGVVIKSPINLTMRMESGELMEVMEETFGMTMTELAAELQPVNFSPRFQPAPAPQSAPNIVVTGTLTPSVKTGRAAKGTITIDIPVGYHINSNHPLEEFLVATKLTVDAPQGIRVGAIVYPPPLLRTFKFSKNKLSVYEGKVVLRFSLTVPASVAPGTVELKANLHYQSCNDSLCFPPKNKDVNLTLTFN
jgi:hypothetical protein